MTPRTRLTRCPRAVGDEGFSLTELSVTMLVMSIIVAATAMLSIGFIRSNGENMTRQEQIDVARSAVDSISRTVRAVVKPAQLPPSCTVTVCDEAFLFASASQMRFYASIDNPGGSVGPSRVEYVVPATGPDAGNLVELIQVPDQNKPVGGEYQYCNATAVTATPECKARLQRRVIARGVQASDATPLFYYYDNTGVRLVPPTGTSLATATMGDIVAVEVRLTVQTPNVTTVEPTTYIQRILLPNAQALIRVEREDTP